MSVTDRIGTLRYFQNAGDPYAHMLQTSTTASSMVTVAAAWLGVGKMGALIIGFLSFLVWPTVAIGVGYAIWRSRIVHKTIENEWKNNPLQARTIELLETIADNTRGDQWHHGRPHAGKMADDHEGWLR